MNKKLLGCLLACSLYSGTLLAQKNGIDSVLLAKQQAELKLVLKNADDQLADLQKEWLDAQKKKAGYDTIGLAKFRYEVAQVKQTRKKLEIEFIKQNPKKQVSLDALKDVIGPIPEDIQLYSRLFEGLAKNIRTSEAGLSTKKAIDRFMKVRIGVEAPLFTAPDTLGNPVKLSDYRGKYVLLDFWASWCWPCRDENPIVVKAYHAFKEKNFDILSVSLDESGKRDAWLKAIHADQLSWQHVSDLKYWNNAVAELYAIRSIPQNFLIDPQGKIIAVNLRGEALIQKLNELIK